MAQFSSQGRMKLKPLVNGDAFYEKHGLSCKVSGGWRRKATSSVKLEFQKEKVGCKSRVFASNSSSFGSKSKEAMNNKGDGLLDEIVEDMSAEFEVDDLAAFKGLVLDISYRPVNVVCWKRAICLEFMEKADVLEYYDQTVNSPSGSFNIPAVLRVPHLLQVVKRRRIRNSLSRKNILYRDNFMCQYCSSGENLTIDHVIPIARGGEWTWENLVTACSDCNSRKGQKTLSEANMKLMKVPKAPRDYDVLAIPLTSTAIKMLRKKKGTPEEWHQYLSKPSS